MYSCKNGCGYENSHRGAMNIHESIHCTLKQKKQGGKAAQKKSNNHECEFRILSPSHQLERQAIEHGYKEICDGCQEIR